MYHRAFPREVVHESKRPERSPIRQRIAHEVHGPPFVGSLRGLGQHPRDADPLLPPASGHREALLAVQALGALVIDHEPFAREQPVQSRTAPARALLGEGTQPMPEHRITRGATRHVAVARGADPGEAAGPTFADVAVRRAPGDRVSSLLGGHHFRPTRSFRNELSRARSAITRFSRRFSSSSCLSFLQFQAAVLLAPPHQRVL